MNYAERSLLCWFRMRVHAVSTIFFMTAVVLVARYRTIVEPVSLVLIISYTSEHLLELLIHHERMFKVRATNA